MLYTINKIAVLVGRLRRMIGVLHDGYTQRTQCWGLHCGKARRLISHWMSVNTWQKMKNTIVRGILRGVAVVLRNTSN